MTDFRQCGGTSVQVVRRLRAMLEQLDELVLPEHRSAVADELRRLDADVRRLHAAGIDLDEALIPDVQGPGGPTRRPPHPPPPPALGG